MHVEQISEGESILSIYAYVIVSKSGIPFYEEKFDDSSVDPNLLAGVSSALSMYVDEFMVTQKLGVEILKKSGLTITSSKTDLSTIITVSSTDLAQEVIEQMKKAQQALEEYYNDKLRGVDRDRSLLDPHIVYQIFDNVGFKMGLRKLLQLHEDNIIAIKEDRTIGPTLRYHMGSLRELIPNARATPDGTKVVNISTIVQHFQDRKLDERMIGNLLVLAYENKLLSFTIL